MKEFPKRLLFPFTGQEPGRESGNSMNIQRQSTRGGRRGRNTQEYGTENEGTRKKELLDKYINAQKKYKISKSETDRIEAEVAGEILTNEYSSQVCGVAYRFGYYRLKGIEMDDLIGYARLGFAEALDIFVMRIDEIESFDGYMTTVVKNNILEGLKKHHNIFIPQSMSSKVNRAKRLFTQYHLSENESPETLRKVLLLHDPEVKKITDEAKQNNYINAILLGLEMQHISRNLLYFSSPIGIGEESIGVLEDGLEAPQLILPTSVDESRYQNIKRERLEPLLIRLSELERQVIQYKFGLNSEEKENFEIAQLLGYSERTIERIIKRSLVKLQKSENGEDNKKIERRIEILNRILSKYNVTYDDVIKGLNLITKREKNIIIARFGLENGSPKTFKEIQYMYKISYARINMLLRNGLQRISGEKKPSREYLIKKREIKKRRNPREDFLVKNSLSLEEVIAHLNILKKMQQEVIKLRLGINSNGRIISEGTRNESEQLNISRSASGEHLKKAVKTLQGEIKKQRELSQNKINEIESTLQSGQELYLSEEISGFIYIAKNLKENQGLLNRQKLLEKLMTIRIPNPEFILYCLDLVDKEIISLSKNVSKEIRFSQLKHLLRNTDLTYPEIAIYLNIHNQSVREKASILFKGDVDFKNEINQLRKKRSQEIQARRKNMVRIYGLNLTQEEIAIKMGIDRKIVSDLLKEIEEIDPKFKMERSMLVKKRQIENVKKLRKSQMELGFEREKTALELINQNKSCQEIADILNISLSQAYVIVRKITTKDPHMSEKVITERRKLHQGKIIKRRMILYQEIIDLMREGKSEDQIATTIGLTRGHIRKILKNYPQMTFSSEN